MFRKELIESGVDQNQIIFINIEALKTEALTNYKALYEHITELLIPEKNMYIFLDETHNVKDYEQNSR